MSRRARSALPPRAGPARSCRPVSGLALFALAWACTLPVAQAAPAGALFQCNTRKHQIVIDGDPATEQFRYRAWNRPKPLSSAPDLELRAGEEVVEGTGVCRYRYYRFTSGNVAYQVADSLGCTETWPPQDAVGRLTVLIGGEVRSSQWCRR